MPDEDEGARTKPTNLPTETPLYRMVRRAFVGGNSGEVLPGTFIRRIPDPDRKVTGDPDGLSLSLANGQTEDATANKIFESFSNIGGVCRLSVDDVHYVAAFNVTELTVFQDDIDHASLLGLPYPVELGTLTIAEIDRAEYLGGKLAELSKMIKFDGKRFPNFSPSWFPVKPSA